MAAHGRLDGKAGAASAASANPRAPVTASARDPNATVRSPRRIHKSAKYAHWRRRAVELQNRAGAIHAGGEGRRAPAQDCAIPVCTTNRRIHFQENRSRRPWITLVLRYMIDCAYDT